MSFDLAVWHPHRHLTAKEAGEVYTRLSGDMPASLIVHPKVEEFYRALIARYPAIEDVPEDKIDVLEVCPWAMSPTLSGSHVLMSLASTVPQNVVEYIASLANEHGLALFDP